MVPRNENCIPLIESAKFIPGRPSRASVYRWAATGALETLKVRGRLFTSHEAIDRMIARDSATVNEPESTAKPRANMHSVDSVDQELKDAGI